MKLLRYHDNMTLYFLPLPLPIIPLHALTAEYWTCDTVQKLCHGNNKYGRKAMCCGWGNSGQGGMGGRVANPHTYKNCTGRGDFFLNKHYHFTTKNYIYQLKNIEKNNELVSPFLTFKVTLRTLTSVIANSRKETESLQL